VDPIARKDSPAKRPNRPNPSTHAAVPAPSDSIILGSFQTRISFPYRSFNIFFYKKQLLLTKSKILPILSAINSAFYWPKTGAKNVSYYKRTT
jgi:hypothetical protein